MTIESAPAAGAPKVTAQNYVRAESDFQMKSYVDNLGCFGKFVHSRQPYDVNHQVTVRGNRDTLYSFGVFDLTSPLTITLPDTGGRYQSLMVVNQDHSSAFVYGPAEVMLTDEEVGSRYALLIVRTFMDPNDQADLEEAYRLQDEIRVEQANSGAFDVPDWNQQEIEQIRSAAMTIFSVAGDASAKCFGKKEDLDPVYWLLGAAVGWGGLPASASVYASEYPAKNDGQTPYTLTVKDVPVDGFWSVTLYDEDGWMPSNPYDAYSYNSVTAQKNGDGSITIHFGGDPDQPNFLPIVPSWNYTLRLYQPREEILDGSWKFPKAREVT